ncbi:uncharacterized protein BT62DRAFT_996672 [Guyanagaster necrorhizus]|uniref:Uncharacterized protein n=1 Tax=Guyanagaster necrorhizus TaxID=856835 RepID=A0A9P8APW9_9AGAR|nr:uncharacterized protein BT62DRAFT_996672 [Guyanagaster necrorhizus MCA 3950]KAG7442282.1 hypothetical protein BT62DRAFT_996672 [Guyanagaster necrorhizus MCA 3950]
MVSGIYSGTACLSRLRQTTMAPSRRRRSRRSHTIEELFSADILNFNKFSVREIYNALQQFPNLLSRGFAMLDLYAADQEVYSDPYYHAIMDLLKNTRLQSIGCADMSVSPNEVGVWRGTFLNVTNLDLLHVTCSTVQYQIMLDSVPNLESFWTEEMHITTLAQWVNYSKFDAMVERPEQWGMIGREQKGVQLSEPTLTIITPDDEVLATRFASRQSPCRTSGLSSLFYQGNNSEQVTVSLSVLLALARNGVEFVCNGYNSESRIPPLIIPSKYISVFDCVFELEDDCKTVHPLEWLTRSFSMVTTPTQIQTLIITMDPCSDIDESTLPDPDDPIVGMWNELDEALCRWQVSFQSFGGWEMSVSQKLKEGETIRVHMKES